MSNPNTIRADKVNIKFKDEDNLPEGWEKTHEEYRRPVTDLNGYYIRSYESENFLVSHDAECKKNGDKVHSAVLLKVKRGENGEKQTSLGTGIYKNVVISDEAPSCTEDKDQNIEAHKRAEKAAFQIARRLMREVNNGKYEHKKYSK
jgi:hypothetical protein